MIARRRGQGRSLTLAEVQPSRFGGWTRTRTRRRWPRTTPLLALAVAMVVAVGVIAGGHSSAGHAASDSRSRRLAQVDPTTGVIVLPLDRYNLTRAERGIFQTANDLAMSRCMKDKGFGRYGRFVDRRDPRPEIDRTFGVWVKASVARYGYRPVPQSQRTRQVMRLNEQQMPAAAERAFLDCIPHVRRLGLVLPAGLDVANGPSVGNGAPLDSPAARAAIERWATCLKAAGAPAPNALDDDWVPPGLLNAPLQQQIRVALIDVECKQRLGTIQALADIEARRQWPYIDTHEARLVQQRRALDALVARSRAYLAQAPELQSAS